MMRASLDYSKLASLYDDYWVFTGDIAFFRDRARAVSGEILELMAGTGRLSMPLLEDGARLTCVDNSSSMLAVLKQKLLDRRFPSKSWGLLPRRHGSRSPSFMATTAGAATMRRRVP